MFWASADDDGCRFGHPDEPTSIKHRGQYKYIDFYIKLLNSTKPFDSSLKKWMRKAAHHSGGVVSLNLHRWRGEPLHHHGGGVCWLFVLLWMDSWRHETIVCKKWYKNNPKKGLCGVTFQPTLACTTPIVRGHTLILRANTKRFSWPIVHRGG